jgi:hypothetical protein
VPFGLFGSRAATPQQQQEEEEEEEVQVAAPALPFAGFFGAKQAPVQVCYIVTVTWVSWRSHEHPVKELQ